MNCIKQSAGNALAALVNPSPGRVEREAAWFARHPVAGGAVLAAVLIAPMLLCALMDGI